MEAYSGAGTYGDAGPPFLVEVFLSPSAENKSIEVSVVRCRGHLLMDDFEASWDPGRG